MRRLAKPNIQEMLDSVIDNRAWSKQLRINSQIVVAGRLAKLVGADEYATSR
jgi:hypothetical protein